MGALADRNPEGEQLFREFVDDISLSPEEMRLYVAMPELSIADVKSLIADREEPCRRATGSSEPNRYDAGVVVRRPARG